MPAAASSKTASKKSPPGGKHHASEGRASAKTTPKNCLMCRLKSSKNNIFREIRDIFERFCCLRLLAVEQLRKNQLPGGNTMPLKDELVPKPRQKTA